MRAFSLASQELMHHLDWWVGSISSHLREALLLHHPFPLVTTLQMISHNLCLHLRAELKILLTLSLTTTSHTHMINSSHTHMNSNNPFRKIIPLLKLLPLYLIPISSLILALVKAVCPQLLDTILPTIKDMILLTHTSLPYQLQTIHQPCHSSHNNQVFQDQTTHRFHSTIQA